MVYLHYLQYNGHLNKFSPLQISLLFRTDFSYFEISYETIHHFIGSMCAKFVTGGFHWGSNSQLVDLKSNALPTELKG